MDWCFDSFALQLPFDDSDPHVLSLSPQPGGQFATPADQIEADDHSELHRRGSSVHFVHDHLQPQVQRLRQEVHVWGKQDLHLLVCDPLHFGHFLDPGRRHGDRGGAVHLQEHQGTDEDQENQSGEVR